ncbi:hypothetical protein RSAG8_02955, partial [Rhizoctonia solani AG-8 WAC10335]
GRRPGRQLWRGKLDDCLDLPRGPIGARNIDWNYYVDSVTVTHILNVLICDSFDHSPFALRLFNIVTVDHYSLRPFISRTFFTIACLGTFYPRQFYIDSAVLYATWVI